MMPMSCQLWLPLNISDKVNHLFASICWPFYLETWSATNHWSPPKSSFHSFSATNLLYDLKAANSCVYFCTAYYNFESKEEDIWEGRPAQDSTVKYLFRFLVIVHEVLMKAFGRRFLGRSRIRKTQVPRSDISWISLWS